MKTRKNNAEIHKNSILSTLKELMLEKVRIEFVFNEVNYSDCLNSSIFMKNGVDTCDILIFSSPS